MSLPEKGNSFPRRGWARPSLETLARAVARLTGANERAVKKWFAARNVPRGDYLVVLMHRSDRVLAAVLASAGRERLLVGLQVRVAQTELARLLRMLDGEEG